MALEDEFVYEKRLKSEFDRWISEYDMLEARKLSKEADEKQSEEIEHLVENLKDDIDYAENLLSDMKTKGKEMYNNIEEEIEKLIKKVEDEFNEIKKKF